MSDVIISRRGSYKTGTGGQMVTEIITFNTDWIVPNGAKDNRFYVRLIGAGGQGPNYKSSGGSGIMNNSELILTPNEIIPITIGQPVNTYNWGTGNTTSFGIYLSGAGGSANIYNPYGGSGGRGYNNGGAGLQFGGGGGYFGSGGNGGVWGGGGGGHSAGMSYNSSTLPTAGHGGTYGGGGGGGSASARNGGNGGKYGGGGGAGYRFNVKGGIGGEFGGNGGNASNSKISFLKPDYNYLKYTETTNAENGTNTIGLNNIEFQGKGEAGGPPKLFRVEWNNNTRYHFYTWGGAPGGGGYGGNGGTSNSFAGGGGGGYGSNGGSVGPDYNENYILKQYDSYEGPILYAAGGGGGGYGGDGESDLYENRSAAGGGYGKESIGRGGGGGGYYCPGGGVKIVINPSNGYVLGGGGLGISDGKNTYASFGSGGTLNGDQGAEPGVCIIQYYI